MRAVVDTNVLVSAAITPAGVTAQVIARGIDGYYELVVSPHLLAELEGVLRRPKIQRLITPDQADQFLLDVRAGSDLVDDPPDIPAVTRDPDDDYLIALARLAHVDYLISGDLDLHDEEQQDPPVITPRDFLTQLDNA